MLNRNLSIIAAISIAIAALGFRGQAAGVSEGGPPTLSGIFELHLDTDKSSYKLGEPIYVLTAVTNATGDPYRVKAVPPWGMCNLIISNDLGELSPTRSGLGYRWGMIDTAVDPPHTTHFISFFDYQQNKYGQWANINDWGYEITAPGTYTIAAVSKVEGMVMVGPSKGEWFRSSESDKSNTVIIKVVVQSH